MKYKRIGLLLVFLVLVSIFAFKLPVNGNDLFDTLLNRLRIYAYIEGPEKIYIHTDRSFYTPGETIWFKAYLVNGITHKASDKSRVVYVELLDEKRRVVEERKLFIEDAGTSGDILIDKNIKQGRYVLRAFTKYMLNAEHPVFFQKEIPIWKPGLENEDAGDKKLTLASSIATPEEHPKIKTHSTNGPVEFFPESGQLLAGISSKVAIKVNIANNPFKALSGKVINELGDSIAHFKVFDNGLGAFEFTPAANTGYYAVFGTAPHEKQVLIPKALEEGYTLRVQSNPDHLLVEVRTNSGQDLEETLLLGHQRGKVFLKHLGSLTVNGIYTVKIATDKLDTGIAHFALFRPNGRAVCERLSYIDHSRNDPKLKVLFDKESYQKRDKVALSINLVDHMNRPLAGNFSMSVVKGSTAVSIDSLGENPRNWLLFDSDVKGTIEHINKLFKDKSTSGRKKVDVFMMTRQWGRFKWKDLLQKGVRKKQTYTAEQGIMINGRTTALNNKYLPKSSTITLGLLGQESYYETKTTKNNGQFSFGPFAFNDSIDVVLDAIEIKNYSSKNTKDISIFVDPSIPAVLNESFKKPKKHPLTFKDIRSYYESIYSQQALAFKLGTDVVQLDEATVKGKKKTKAAIIEEELNTLTAYGKSRNRIILDSILAKESTSLMDIINLMPGVQVKGNYPNQSIKIRSSINSINLSTEPLFLLDGVAIPFQAVQQMNTFGVLFVDALTGSEASFYGTRGANGVIAVYTDRGSKFSFAQDRYPGITNFTIYGFYSTKKFNGPNYGNANSLDSKSDYRTTLHWEPNIRIKGSHKPSISFYTGDSAGTYLVQLEGITSEGKPLSASYSFSVE